MRSFPLCPACRREYEDPGDRRFHAEPNACPVCGPRVRLLRLDEPADGVVELAAGAEGDPAAPIRAAAELLLGGEILAVKGLGGFHLACDATDGEAVRRLKQRKRRPDKPLAVMFAGLDELRAHCRVGAGGGGAADVAGAPDRPARVARDRPLGRGRLRGAGGGGRRAGAIPEVAVRQRYLGAMLPYTPLHVLLLRAAGRPLVMTSGNLAEEPIVKGWEEIGRLTPIADAYLVHDREIAVRYDDSVAQVRGGRPRLIRRSRGYAPFPVALPRPLPQTLAPAPSSRTRSASRATPTPSSASTSATSRTWRRWSTTRPASTCTGGCSASSPRSSPTTSIPSTWRRKYALALPQAEKVAVQHHHAHVAARLVEHGA